ncbi:MAG TPA: prepilin-type N-terminal cleavage/methylation domain-containing protein [Aliidongia sp.]|uniref:prepilin-type N-terminal cleavage/methylation domain-containing protein n=1 Tax=Aliidongia sp. TaxID=1914230 RepID=UPI002DDCCEAD|nr:prepilin-type N-terminal cleavage/methylation domain-containing protein [Aliidongia sp.]HEV2673545.1 prepilin-type N-terminal cleavage/methylation domain-containing protein [Aliidongia sp.]
MAADAGRRQAGFTLMEILVALVVLGILMAGLGQGMRLGMAAWTRQAALVDETADLDAVDRTIRGLLTSATTGAVHGRNDFEGETDSVSFDGVLPLAFASSGRRAKITLAVDDRHRLMLRWAGMLIDPNTTQPASGEAVVAENLDHIELAYWQGGLDAPGWRDRWTATTAPALIRLRLVFAGKDRRHWPDMVVAPLVEEGGG